MSENQRSVSGKEKRRYTRLKGYFPVEFTVVRLQDDLLDLPWSKGHTSNVSQGGICLETDVLSEAVIRYLSKGNIYLDLRIHLPSSEESFKAVAEVVWYQPMQGCEKCYIIGLDFRSIVENDLKNLLSQAQADQKDAE